MLLLAAAALLAGCVDPDGAVEDEDAMTTVAGLIEVVEVYDGDLVTLQAGGEAEYSHDQLGDNHREFFVVPGTTEVRLTLRTTDVDLTVRAVPLGCSVDDACAHSFSSELGRGNLTITAPEPGPWMAYLFMAAHQPTNVPLLGPVVPAAAEDAPYRLTMTKTQPPHASLEMETYTGELVVTHLGAIRVSPDQLGDVYREFWVHEGTMELTLDFAASDAIALAVGQSFRQRDRFTEEIHNLDDGSITLTYEDPEPGGWYFIAFHHADTGPGVEMVSYTMDIMKDRGGSTPAAALDDLGAD